MDFDPVGLEKAIGKLQDLLDTEIPKLGNVVNGAITSLGTVGGTLILKAETATHGIIKDAFDRLDTLAAKFSLPLRITVSKPEDSE